MVDSGVAENSGLSGLEMPKLAVVPDAFDIGFNPVGIEELALMSFAKVPIKTHRSNREISPPIANGQIAEVHVAHPLAVV
jgi:hypothetical protein